MPQGRRRAVGRALVERARRMGPLPTSALDRAPAPAEPDGLTPWLSRWLDGTWDALGRPDPLVVVDVGAGDGSRAVRLLSAGPRCRGALRWLLVEDAPPAAPLRPELRLEDPALVLGPALPGDDPDAPPSTPPGIGPLVAVLGDLPAGLEVAVVLAVGWLSRLPADTFEWRNGRWWEVRLAAGADDGALDELLVDAGEHAPPGPAGAEGERRCEVVAARRWLAAARRVATVGTVVAVDLLSPPALPLDGPGAAPLRTEEVPPMLAAVWDMEV